MPSTNPASRASLAGTFSLRRRRSGLRHLYDIYTYTTENTFLFRTPCKPHQVIEILAPRLELVRLLNYHEGQSKPVALLTRKSSAQLLEEPWCNGVFI